MKNANGSISLIRMFAMLMVIACHILQILSDQIGTGGIVKQIGDYCANGVQIFLFISGYLYANKNAYFEKSSARIAFVGKNFRKILFPYYVYVILVIFPVYSFLKPEVMTPHSVVGVLFASNTISGVHHLWFIPYILLCYLLTPVLYDLREYGRNHHYSAMAMIFIICATLEIYCYFFKSYFVPEWICAYCIGYYWDDLCSETKQGTHLLLAKVGVIFIMLVTNIFRYYTNYVIEVTRFEILFEKISNWSQVFFALVFFMLFFNRRKPKKILSRMVAFSDKYSYTIYLAHMIYVKGVLCTLSLTSSVANNLVLTCALILASGIGLFYICKVISFLLAFGKVYAQQG